MFPRENKKKLSSFLKLGHRYAMFRGTALIDQMQNAPSLNRDFLHPNQILKSLLSTPVSFYIKGKYQASLRCTLPLPIICHPWETICLSSSAHLQSDGTKSPDTNLTCSNCRARTCSGRFSRHCHRQGDNTKYTLVWGCNEHTQAGKIEGKIMRSVFHYLDFHGESQSEYKSEGCVLHAQSNPHWIQSRSL